MYDLITQSYSEAAASRYRTYQLSEYDRDAIIGISNSIVTNSPSIPNACVLMSSLWASLIREHTEVPCHVVAGNLRIRDKLAFGAKHRPQSLAEVFSSSNNGWEGHCWIDVCGYLGEISLFRTGVADSSPLWLKDAVIDLFGDLEVLVDSRDGMRQAGFFYDSLYVLTNEQIELAEGAIQLVKALNR
jgi:hypothetical protein